jgi:hypothetical protein
MIIGPGIRVIKGVLFVLSLDSASVCLCTQLIVRHMRRSLPQHTDKAVLLFFSKVCSGPSADSLQKTFTCVFTWICVMFHYTIYVGFMRYNIKVLHHHMLLIFNLLTVFHT